MARFQWKESKPTEFIGVVHGDVHDKLRKTALNVHNQIVHLSPVDTGLFRRNNIVSIDSPDYSVKSGTDYSANEGAVQAQIISSPKETKRIYIQNNLPYAERLENGWSKQAATGIYKVAFDIVARSGE